MAVKKKIKKAVPKKTVPAKKKSPVKSSSPAAPKKKEIPKKVAAKKKLSKSVTVSSKTNSSDPLGKKFSCYSCGTKFYDLNKPEKLCPKCGSDQMAKPALKSRLAALRASDYEVEDEETPIIANEDEEAFIEEEEIEENADGTETSGEEE
jgi:uncharacterized protein (TIGR02300 family)